MPLEHAATTSISRLVAEVNYGQGGGGLAQGTGPTRGMSSEGRGWILAKEAAPMWHFFVKFGVPDVWDDVMT